MDKKTRALVLVMKNPQKQLLVICKPEEVG